MTETISLCCGSNSLIGISAAFMTEVDGGRSTGVERCMRSSSSSPTTWSRLFHDACHRRSRWMHFIGSPPHLIAADLKGAFTMIRPFALYSADCEEEPDHRDRRRHQRSGGRQLPAARRVRRAPAREEASRRRRLHHGTHRLPGRHRGTVRLPLGVFQGCRLRPARSRPR